MTTTKTAAAVFASVMLCAPCQLAAAPAANDPATRVARWREDLDYFAREFPAKQMDFAILLPRDRFDQEVTELKRQAPELSDAEIVFALMRIVASLGVAHTSIAFGSISGTAAPHSYPVEMQWFSDGLAVMATAPEYQQALGCRVVRIGAKTPEQVEAALAPYIPHENDAYLHFQSPRYMTLAELMQHEQIAEPSGSLRLTCAKVDGEKFTLDIAAERSVKTGRVLVKAEAASHIPEEFRRKHPGAFYWYEYLPAAQTIYIQYNKCRNEPGNPFVNFAGNLFTFADTHPIQRVIVDLRFNGGGSSSILQPLVEGLQARPALPAKGHLYTLIGSQTFSSGLMAAMDFRDRLHAILIGGPTGNKPNHFGEQRNFSLPNSRLVVHYSTKHFHLVRDADPSTLAPDIFVPYSLNDFLAGRDPALDAAIRHPLQ
jgi:hypothetical protein